MTANIEVSGVVQRLLADNLPKENERATLESLMKKDPRAALSLLSVYFEQKHRHKAALQELQAKLLGSPWHPATIIRWVSGAADRVLVAAGGRRLIVSIGPSVNTSALRGGTSVYLNQDMNVLLGLCPDLKPCGSVGIFKRLHNGRAILDGLGDQEFVVDVTAEMKTISLKHGDLLIYSCRWSPGPRSW
jgi:ATP-dependent 26S proteasome regulatory subunit